MHGYSTGETFVYITFIIKFDGILPSNNALAQEILQELQEKVLFSFIPPRSCEILWDLAGILLESYSNLPIRFF